MISERNIYILMFNGMFWNQQKMGWIRLWSFRWLCRLDRVTHCDVWKVLERNRLNRVLHFRYFLSFISLQHLYIKLCFIYIYIYVLHDHLPLPEQFNQRQGIHPLTTSSPPTARALTHKLIAVGSASITRTGSQKSKSLEQIDSSKRSGWNKN